MTVDVICCYGSYACMILLLSCLQADFSLSVGCFGIDAEMVDPKMHEMVSDRSSRAENWTDLRKFSMRVFFGSKNP